MSPAVARLRCVGVWALLTVASAVLAAEVGPALTAPGAAHPTFEALLVRVCAGAALLAMAWWWLAASAVVVEAMTHRVGRTPGVPVVLRRAVLLGCGVAVAAAVAAPVGATPGDLHEDRTSGSSSLAGLPYPDRAAGAPVGAITTVGPPRDRVVRPGRPPARAVTVRPGDTLWGLARAELGRDAEDAAIAERWRQIYAANRAVIGADPDLIHPAQRLRVPER